MIDINKNTRFIVSDFESENLHQRYNRPWNLSYVIFQNNKILEEHDYFIWWPDLKMSKGAAEATKFDPKEYKEKAEDPKVVFNKVKHIFYPDKPTKDWIVFHNGLNFDVYMLRNWFKEIGEWRGEKEYIFRFLDSNAIARAAKNNNKADKNHFLSWQYKWANTPQKGIKTSLTTLGKEQGVEFDETKLHRGLPDVRLNAQILNPILYQTGIL